MYNMFTSLSHPCILMISFFQGLYLVKRKLKFYNFNYDDNKSRKLLNYYSRMMMMISRVVTYAYFLLELEGSGKLLTLDIIDTLSFFLNINLESKNNRFETLNYYFYLPEI